MVVHSQTVTGPDAFAFVRHSGEAHRISPQEALRLARCEPDTSARPPRHDHHDMVATAFDGPLTAPSEKTAVVPTGVQGQCYNKLKAHASHSQLNLLVSEDDLNAALEDLRRFPLLPTTMQTLSGALRERSPADLTDLIVKLHKDNLLCTYPDTDCARREPRVICSMGFVQ